MAVKVISLGGGSGSVNWGSIGGILTNQTDLVAALGTKANVFQLPLSNNSPSTNQTIPSGFSTIVCDVYEIQNNLTLEIGNNAKLEIT